MSLAVEKLIEALGLQPHPEGGYFREVFRAPLVLKQLPRKGLRSASTAIYFLLPRGTFSAFHLVKGADEVWHHYLGGAVELHTISNGGEYRVTRLGSDIAAGERPQAVVPADVLQAAVPVGKDFALCGCTVAPGFDLADFVMPARAELVDRFPAHAAAIERLTRQ